MIISFDETLTSYFRTENLSKLYFEWITFLKANHNLVTSVLQKQNFSTKKFFGPRPLRSAYTLSTSHADFVLYLFVDRLLLCEDFFGEAGENFFLTELADLATIARFERHFTERKVLVADDNEVRDSIHFC